LVWFCFVWFYFVMSGYVWFLLIWKSEFGEGILTIWYLKSEFENLKFEVEFDIGLFSGPILWQTQSLVSFSLRGSIRSLFYFDICFSYFVWQTHNVSYWCIMSLREVLDNRTLCYWAFRLVLIIYCLVIIFCEVKLLIFYETLAVILCFSILHI
jgi:hypothetical protein